MKILILSLAALTFASGAPAETLTVYIGTQTGGDVASEGIYRTTINLESGELSPLELAARIGSPNFLELSPDGKFLYTVARGQGAGAAFAYAIDPASGGLTEIGNRPCGKGPCHITVSPDGKCVLAADYGGGAAFSFPVVAGGGLGPAAAAVSFTGSGPDPQRQEAPHAHSATVSPDGRFAYFADLGTDRVMTFALDAGTAALTPADPPFAKLQPAAGPVRHMTFSPDGSRAYVINELDSTITVFAQDKPTGALQPLQTISTLPDGFEGTSKCAEVRVHPTGKFVYGSNRGFDSIAVFSVSGDGGVLAPVEFESEDVVWPRNFNLTPDGKWCVVANADADNIRVFSIDQDTGALAATPHRLKVGKPMCIRFLAH